MDALIRSTTLGFSRRVEGYEHINSTSDHNKQIVIPRSKNQRLLHHGQMVFSLSYRRERARQRQIFLQTYKLTSIDGSTARKSRPKKLKKVVIKLKSAVVSVLSLFRADTMGSCSSKSAVSVALPSRVVKCC